MPGLLGETVTLNARFTVLLDVVNGVPQYYTATWYSNSFTVGSGVEIQNLAVTGTYTTPQGYTGTISGTITVDVANSSYSVNFSGTQQPGDIYFEFTSLTGESIASISSLTATNSGFTPGVNFAYDPYIDGTGITSRLGPLGMQPGVNLTQNVTFSFTPSTLTNTPPVAVGNSYSVNEDNTLSGQNVLSNDTDANSDPLTAILVSGPSHASSFTLNPNGTFTYTPAANYNGADSFTYKANDGTADSNTVTVNITVNAINDAPAGTDKAVTIVEDAIYTFATGDFGFTDVDGNTLAAVRITTIPAAGTGTIYLDSDGPGGAAPVAVTANTLVNATDIADGKLTFVPAANASGANLASFTFQVRDSGSNSGQNQNTDQSPNSFVFSVTAVNDAPTVTTSGGNTAFAEGVNVASTPVAVDAALTLSDPDNATLTTATVQITGNLRPGQDSLAFTNTSSAIYGDITASYVQATGALTLTSASGTATVAQFQAALRAVTYTNSSQEPNEGNRTISFSASDGTATGLIATKTLTVTAYNDSPSGADATITIAEDAVRTLAVSDFAFSDVDGDSFARVRFTAAPVGGKLFFDADGPGGAGVPVEITTFPSGNYTVADLNAGRVTFVPTANLNGTGVASVQFVVGDDGGSMGPGLAFDQTPNTLTFNITAVNDAPVNTVPGGQTINEDAILVLSTANGNAVSVADVDVQTLTVTLSVAHGTLTLAGTTGLSFAAGDGTGDATMTFSGSASAINTALNGLTYTPAANYYGADAISVTTGDGSASDVDSVGITINSVNDAPVAGNDAFAINEDVVSANLWAILLSNDTDVDLGDTRSIASVDATGTLGRLVFNAATQSLEYVADTAYFDDLIPGSVVTDTFKYNVIDSAGAQSTATVTVTVTVTFSGTVITLGDGPDNYTGTPNEDHINGAGGNDVLDGLADDDLLEGAGGNDVLIGGAGRDRLDGGDGSDTASYRTAAVGVLASLGNPGVNTGDAAGDSYTGIENLEGSGFDDILAGNNVANDFLGGGGTDTVTYVWAGAGVVASLGNGTVGFGGGTTQTGEAAGDRYNSIEVLEGSNFNDTLFAAAGGSTLRGLDGADTLYGLGGADLLEGGAGQDMLIGDGGADELWGGGDNDTLRGDAGADHLYGEGGNDVLDGGAGIDVLDGGAGNDIYTGGGAADMFVIADLGGTDTITDFKRAQGDKIDLSSLAIDEWIGTQAFHNDAGEVRIRNAGSQWWLEGDTNGDGIADFSVAMGSVKLIETDLLIGPGLPA